MTVFWTVRSLYKYLLSMRFTIVTDHQPNQFLFNLNKTRSKSTAAPVLREDLLKFAEHYYFLVTSINRTGVATRG